MSTPILLLNAGSSSVKYQVIDVDTEEVLVKGLVERIGGDDSVIEHTAGGETHAAERPLCDHEAALQAMVDMFEAHGTPLADIQAIGHRAVHGGSRFTSSCRVTDDVIQALRDLSPLAPLHNPPAIDGILAARHHLPGLPDVTVFDTAFFADLPAEAYTYAVPTDVAAQYKVRRYGFHGTSHNYVAHQAARAIGKPYDEVNQIVCHLGNGASVSAIQRGRPIETSMGLTPMQGLVMGTRSGDIDPGLFAYLVRAAGMTNDDVDTMLNKGSGLLGLSGSNDMRDVLTARAAGDERAALAFDVYVHRLVFYIGGYMALLCGIDVLSFTAGVGENAAEVRAAVLQRLAGLGLHLDPARNELGSREPRLISTDDSRVKVLVVPTNEELQMAREVKAVIEA